jgi:endonuclease YncB( thermonuclease family)
VGLYEYRGEVSRVIDGDTIELAWKDYGDGLRVHTSKRNPLRYRLAAINAYEKTLRSGTTPEEKALGIEATAWLKERVEGKRVRLKSVASGAKGSLGRYLVYLFDDGEDDERLEPLSLGCYNLRLLDKGYAVVSKYDDGDIYARLGYEREGD